MVFVGNLQAETDIVQQCRIALFLHVFWLLPTFPDPYAANFDTLQTLHLQMGRENFEILHVQIQWNGAPAKPLIQLAILSQSKRGLGYLANVGEGRRAGGFVLLDLSTRADLFGVKIAPDYDRLGNESLNVQGSAPAFGFTDISLAFNQALRLAA